MSPSPNCRRMNASFTICPALMAGAKRGGGPILALKIHLDLHRRSAGQRREAERAAGVPAVGLGAEDFVQQIGAAVDDLGLIVKIGRRVDAAEHLDDAKIVE